MRPIAEHRKVLSQSIQEQVAQSVVLLVQKHNFSLLNSQAKRTASAKHFSWLLDYQVVDLQSVALEGRRGKGRSRPDFLAIVVEESWRVSDFHEGDKVDREKGFEGQHFPDDGLEHFRDIH